MCKIKLCLFTGMLMMFLLAACQPLIIPVTPTAEGIEQSTTPTSPPPVTATTPRAETVPAVATAVLTSTETSAITVSSATATVSETITTAATVTETLTATASAETSTEPTLTVLVASLRLRSGPGTAYDILGAATQGEKYSIVGQADNCQWYQVPHPQLGEVWLAGGDQYVAASVSCDQVAAVLIPTPQPTAVVPAQAPQADNPSPTQPVADPLPADQGCLILQNQLGPELTFTFTSADSSWNDSIKVSAEHDIPYCFKPGNYRVTVDAPPPWPSLNLDFAIQAGYRAYFPIRPQ